MAWLVGVLSWNFESDVLLNLIIAIMINSVFAIFEEIGWRGYLLPHFGAPGSFGAALLVGFLHGVWHLPLMLMTTAYNPAGNRLITVPIFLAVLTGAGVIYAYLRWTSGSIWPVIIAHGTFNAVLGAFAAAAVTQMPQPPRTSPAKPVYSPLPGSRLPHLSWPDVTDQCAQPSPMSGGHRLANTWPQTGARGGHRRPEPAANASNRSGKRDNRSHTTRICYRLLLHLTGCPAKRGSPSP